MPLSVEEIFSAGGLLSQHLSGYEQRDEQLAMARAVARSFAAGEHLLAEAGTGVGKSFAYLVPAILCGVEHRHRVIVSTYTIALQEQLIAKDLPFLRQVLPVEFSAVLGKGRNNYLCFRRMALTMKNRMRLLTTESQQEQLDRLSEWAMETEDGSQQDMDFEIAPEVWTKVRAEHGLCRGAKCSAYGKCHLRAARLKMLQAHVLVVNHALYFSDLALPEEAGSILGDYSLAVLDEAHTLERVASDHFGRSASSSAIQGALRELYNDRTDRGMLALMQAKDAIAAVNRASNACDGFFRELAACGAPDVASNGRICRGNVVPDQLSPALRELAQEIKKLRKGVSDDEAADMAGHEQRVAQMAEEVEQLAAQGQEEHAYWVIRRSARGGDTVTLASAPINVAPILRELVFDKVNSVVLTSATLATARGGTHGFDYIRRRLGLEDGQEVLLASPFDFRRQARLYVETKLGDPNDLDAFVPAACEAIEHYVQKSQGRCFVLFTSYAMLRAVAERLEEFALGNQYTLLVQGGALPRSRMLQHFRKQPRCVLLGTISFWQGVDVAGEALSNVIITKLPFAVPNEPIIEARMDAIRRSGGNPFPDYQLPEAIILFKQGFGRLIRSRTDTGFVVVLDHRLATRPYGRQFLAALPDMEVVRDDFGKKQH